MRTQELNPAAVAGDISEREIRATHETRPLNPQRVAVLPFHNQSADSEQEYFCDRITDDIIHALSHIPGLNVIGHASVFAFKGVAQEARDVGAKLGSGANWP
jgi:TolB-like protein